MNSPRLYFLSAKSEKYIVIFIIKATTFIYVEKVVSFVLIIFCAVALHIISFPIALFRIKIYNINRADTEGELE